jgi:phosphoribosyl 1,2-cyclic phosphodiesterase
MAFPNESGLTSVLVECGLPYKDIQKRMFDNGLAFGNIKACLITHAHKDHSEALSDLLDRNINVYANEKTLEPYKDNPLAHIMEIDRSSEILKDVYAYAFNTVHDVESVGYVIYDKYTNTTILFINDTRTFDIGKLKGLNFDYIFIECNHVRKQLEIVLQKAIESGDQAKVFKYTRQVRYHLSLAGTKKMLRQLGLSNTKAVFLMHLSDDLGRAEVMKREIEYTMKVDCYVCGKNGGIK